MGMSNAWESLHSTALELARSAPIKQRLVNAYRRHLSSLPADQLPGEVRETFDLLMATLHGIAPLRGEDAVTASVRKMSVQEADECAALLVEMYGLTSRAMIVSERPSAQVVKLHALERERDRDGYADAHMSAARL